MVGRLRDDGKRFVANHGDEETLRRLGEGKEEGVGLEGWVRCDAQGGNMPTFSAPTATGSGGSGGSKL